MNLLLPILKRIATGETRGKAFFSDNFPQYISLDYLALRQLIFDGSDMQMTDF